MSDEDFEFLSEHQESAHPLSAPLDYTVRVSERVLHLDRANYFVGSRDTDWHLPLLVTLREEATNNQRQRTSKGWQRVADKQTRFAEKGERKGKGKGKEQYRASDQSPSKVQGKAPKPWNQPGPRRSLFEEPEDDWLGT